MSALAMRSKAYWGYSPAFMAACRHELRIPPGDIANGPAEYHVAEQAGRIVGFCGAAPAHGLQYELEALFVEPAHIGTGIGRRLIRHALGRVAERGGRSLVIQGDPNAERFYRAAGGEHTGHRESLSVPGRFLPVFTIRVPAR